jgi:hypothetical protein
MNKPSIKEIELAIYLTRIAYDSVIFTDPNLLLDILNSEYDWSLELQDIIKYTRELSMDEEDYRLIYKHIL